MDLPIVDFGGDNRGVISVPESLFERDYAGTLVQQFVEMSRARGRQGTRAQKTRAEVRHTTKKLFRQKGTGRARAGHLSTPIRRGGGRAFPARPDENFDRKINRRMFRTGMAVILSQLVREQRFVAVRNLQMDACKTKAAHDKIKSMNISGRILFVDTIWDENYVLSCRNMPNIALVSHAQLLPTDLIKAEYVVFSEEAIARSAEVWCEA